MTNSIPNDCMFRVWHVPQIPGPMFYTYVKTLPEAILIIETLAYYDLFQYNNKIKPDYSNSAGIEVREIEYEETVWNPVDAEIGDTPGEEYADALREFGGEYSYTHANFTPEKTRDIC